MAEVEPAMSGFSTAAAEFNADTSAVHPAMSEVDPAPSGDDAAMSGFSADTSGVSPAVAEVDPAVASGAFKAVDCCFTCAG